MDLANKKAQARMGNMDATNVDKELVQHIVMAIKAGYYHLDGAEGMAPGLLTFPSPHTCIRTQPDKHT